MLACAYRPLMRVRERGMILSMTPLAKWLKEARAARGLSMRKLGEAADVSHVHIGNIEKGGGASRDMIRRLAKELVPEGLLESEREQVYRRLWRSGLQALIDSGYDESGQIVGKDASNRLEIYNQDGLVITGEGDPDDWRVKMIKCLMETLPPNPAALHTGRPPTPMDDAPPISTGQDGFSDTKFRKPEEDEVRTP